VSEGPWLLGRNRLEHRPRPEFWAFVELGPRAAVELDELEGWPDIRARCAQAGYSLLEVEEDGRYYGGGLF
jgi:hypothetical protein